MRQRSKLVRSTRADADDSIQVNNMVNCSFCGNPIEKGTGLQLIKKDGKVMYFCSTKCEKNTALKRKARTRKWTEASRIERGKTQ